MTPFSSLRFRPRQNSRHGKSSQTGSSISRRQRLQAFNIHWSVVKTLCRPVPLDGGDLISPPATALLLSFTSLYASSLSQGSTVDLAGRRFLWTGRDMKAAQQPLLLAAPLTASASRCFMYLIQGKSEYHLDRTISDSGYCLCC